MCVKDINRMHAMKYLNLYRQNEALFSLNNEILDFIFRHFANVPSLSLSLLMCPFEINLTLLLPFSLIHFTLADKKFLSGRVDWFLWPSSPTPSPPSFDSLLFHKENSLTLLSFCRMEFLHIVDYRTLSLSLSHFYSTDLFDFLLLLFILVVHAFSLC